MSKGTQPKGFAGLASLVSDLEENEASPPHEAFSDDELGLGSEAGHVRGVAKDSSASAVTEEKDEGRGFSAASSLLSEAEDERAATTQGGIDSEGRERETEMLGAETTGATSAGRSADLSPSRKERREPVASHQAKPSRPRSSALKWLLLVVFGVVALHVYDLAHKEDRRPPPVWAPTPEPRSTPSSPTPATPESLATPTAPESVTPPARGAEQEPYRTLAGARREPSRGANPSETSPATKSQAEPEEPVNRARASDLEYSQPPVGRDKVLKVAQIRWCLREEIRIETLRTRATTNAEIEQFNRLVSGYNSRCGSYRYRPAALARAQLDVEEQRREIVASISPAWSSSPLESPAEPTASPSESGGKANEPVAQSSGVAESGSSVETVPAGSSDKASPEAQEQHSTFDAEPSGSARDTALSDAVPTSETGPERTVANAAQVTESANTASESEVRDTSEAEDRTEPVREAPTDPRLLTREIQEALTALGYEPGPIDGIYGPKTKRAIQAFERAMGMKPTGTSTTELWWSLQGQVSRRERLNRGSQRQEI